MNNTINGRIKKIREIFCNGSNIEFAKKLKKEPNTTSNWVREGYSVGRGVSSEISLTFGVELDWLLTGEGEMLKAPKNPFSQISPKQIENIASETIAAELVKLYQTGEIFSAEVHNRIVAEKDKRIEELQRENWELQKRIEELEK